ncbi:MAG: hypothetical protein ACFFCZ_24590 [Promethearchaeota archaeon]
MHAITCRQSGIIRIGEDGPTAAIPFILYGVQVCVRDTQVNGNARGVDCLIGWTHEADHRVYVVRGEHIDS